MHRFRSLSPLLLILLLISCGKALPSLDGIDKAAWANDRNGCQQKRLAMKDALMKEKEKLLALKETQIVSLLGKPDRNELLKRSQKFYHYYLEPSLECKGRSDTSALKLLIRFNAMGLAKEISIE